MIRQIVSRLLAAFSVLLAASVARATDVRVHVEIDTGAGIIPAQEAVVWVPGVFGKRTALRDVSIDLHDRRFAPHVTLAPIGTTVHIANLDPFDHDIFSPSPAKRFDLGLIAHGEERNLTFMRGGVIQLFSNRIAAMKGYVIAVDSRAYGTTDLRGDVLLSDIPTGNQTIAIWHELTGERREDIKVQRSAEIDLSYTLDGKRAKNEAPHLNKFGEPYAEDSEGRHLY